MRVGVLGEVRVFDGDESRSVTAPQEQVLLVALAMMAGQAVSSGRLIDTIWGDEPPASASAALKALVHRVRRRHGRNLVVTAPSGYRLGSDVRTDHGQVLELIDQAYEALTSGAPRRAVPALEAASHLFRGEPAPGLATTTSGILIERQIVELRSRVNDLLLQARVAGGGGEELIGELEAAVEADPLAERNWERLMLALYRSGRQAAALEAFTRARTSLVERAGIEPGPALVDLEQRMLDQDPELLGGVESRWDPEQAAPAITCEVAVPTDLDWFQRAAPLSGRDDEVATAVSALEACFEDRRRAAILISGDPGMGKTRLSGELATVAAERGAIVAYGSCDPGSVGSYRPFAMALDRLSTLHPSAFVGLPLEQVSHIAPGLRDRYELDRAAPDSIGSGDEQRIHASFSTLLTELAGDRGLVLVLDDLHWAAPPTITLLRHLVHDPVSTPLVVVATYRPRDLIDTSPLMPALADLHRAPHCTPIHLERLGRDGIRSLIASSTGQEASDEVTDRVDHATGGNPYLALSTLRHLIDGDLVVRRNEQWELTARALDSLPAGIRHLISQQITALSPEATSLLHVASIAGLAFRLSVVAEVAGLETDTALDAIEAAASVGLVEEDGFDRWRWDHDLARGIVADQISTTRRVQTHWRIARALSGSSGADHHDIAHHTTQGRLAAPDNEASELLGSAAEFFLRRDPISALRYAESAREALADGTENTHLLASILTTRAIAKGSAVGDPSDPEVVEAYEVARLAANATGDPDLILRAAVLDGQGTVTGRLIGSERHIEAAMVALSLLPTDAWNQRALLLAHLLQLHHRFVVTAPSDIRRDLLALLEANRVSPEVELRIRGWIGGLLTDPSRLIRPSLPTVNAWSQHDPTRNSLLKEARHSLSIGDLDWAESRLQDLMARADDDDLLWSLTVRLDMAVAHSARGETREIRKLLQWIAARNDQFGQLRPLVETIRLSLLSVITLHTGSDEGAVAAFSQLADQSRAVVLKSHPDIESGPTIYRTLSGWLAMYADDHILAGEDLQALAPEGSTPWIPIEFVAMYVELICRYRPDLAVESDAHEVLSSASGRWLRVLGASLGPVDRYLGLLAKASDQDPMPHIEAARSSAEAAGARFWLERIDTIDW